MYPILFSIGPLTVYSFGVMVALGFYLGASATVGEYKRRGHDPEQMWNFLVWVFLAGLVGSRLLSASEDIPALLESRGRTLLSGGGFVWYGGLAGGFIAAWLLRRSYKMRFSTILECTALGLPIGQAVGRIGCHIAGDGDWGVPTDLPWGVAYDRAIVGWPHPEGVFVHPTPIYEALAYTGVFLLLLAIRRRDPPVGTLFAVYLLGMGLSRFLVEFIRTNPTIALELTRAQLISLVLVSGAGLWLLRKWAAVLAVSALVVLAAAGCTGRGLEPGDRAPGFVLPRMDGSVQKLLNYRGRPVLLNHWATWCPPCVEELPVLNTIAREYGPKGLVVLALAADEDLATVARFLEEHPTDFEVLLDASGAVGTQYKITGYPETFLIDRDGRVAEKIVGPIPALGGRPGEGFVRSIEALLGG